MCCAGRRGHGRMAAWVRSRLPVKNTRLSNEGTNAKMFRRSSADSSSMVVSQAAFAGALMLVRDDCSGDRFRRRPRSPSSS